MHQSGTFIYLASQYCKLEVAFDSIAVAATLQFASHPGRRIAKLKSYCPGFICKVLYIRTQHTKLGKPKVEWSNF